MIISSIISISVKIYVIDSVKRQPVGKTIETSVFIQTVEPLGYNKYFDLL